MTRIVATQPPIRSRSRAAEPADKTCTIDTIESA